MLLATLTLTVFAVFPHHHHGGRICTVTEICDMHAPSHEEGSGEHHHAGDTGHHNHTCLAESEFITSSTKENIKCKVCLCNNCTHIHHFPILCLLAEFLIYQETTASKPDYGEFIVLYKSINASQPYGLRAPPFTLL